MSGGTQAERDAAPEWAERGVVRHHALRDYFAARREDEAAVVLLACVAHVRAQLGSQGRQLSVHRPAKQSPAAP